MDERPPPLPSVRLESTWWKRNWKWFLPVGCLTGCLTLIIIGLVFASVIGLAVFGALKSSDVYKNAVSRAKASQDVIEALGSPIREGFFASGNTNITGTSGEVSLSIPISGPKGKGTIYVEANKSAGQWDYTKLEVEIEETHETIDLLESESSTEEL